MIERILDMADRVVTAYETYKESQTLLNDAYRKDQENLIDPEPPGETVEQIKETPDTTSIHKIAVTISYEDMNRKALERNCEQRGIEVKKGAYDKTLITAIEKWDADHIITEVTMGPEGTIEDAVEPDGQRTDTEPENLSEGQGNAINVAQAQPDPLAATPTEVAVEAPIEVDMEVCRALLQDLIATHPDGADTGTAAVFSILAKFGEGAQTVGELKDKPHLYAPVYKAAKSALEGLKK